jgi:hypothetical protein
VDQGVGASRATRLTYPALRATFPHCSIPDTRPRGQQRNKRRLWITGMRNDVRRNGIARSSGPWSSYMLAHVRSGEPAGVRRSKACAARATVCTATKASQNPNPGWRALVSVAEFWHGELGQHCCPITAARARPQAIPAGRAGMRTMPIASEAPNERPRKKRQNGAARLPGTTRVLFRSGAPAGAAGEAGAPAA